MRATRFFFHSYKIESVLPVYAPKVFKLQGCLAKKEIQQFYLLLRNQYLILKIISKAASAFLFWLSMSLVNFLHPHWMQVNPPTVQYVQMCMSYADFGTIFRITRVIVAYLKGFSASAFIKASETLYFFSTKRHSKNLEAYRPHTERTDFIF